MSKCHLKNLIKVALPTGSLILPKTVRRSNKAATTSRRRSGLSELRIFVSISSCWILEQLPHFVEEVVVDGYYDISLSTQRVFGISGGLSGYVQKWMVS